MGNRALEMSGMMDAVISLCASEDVIHQQVAVEALIHATSKAKRASFITANGVALLKDLYKKSENDRIRVRALVVSDAAKVKDSFLKKVGGQNVFKANDASFACYFSQGLCKLGSAGGTDFSMKQFAEGSTLKLAKQCRKYVGLR